LHDQLYGPKPDLASCNSH